MRRCLTPSCALVVVLLGCSAPGAAQGAAEGREAAEREIAAGRPCLLFLGMPSPDQSPLEPSTGLLRYSAGCVVSDRSSAHVEAHNEAILAALREGRLEGMTFGDRAMTAEEARAPFADGGGWEEVAVGGSGVQPPGTPFVVEVAQRFGKEGDTPYVFVVGEAGGRTELVYLGEPRARVAFAHGGRTLLVRDDAYRVVRTFDLARALELQVFPDDDRGW